jgi:hypothetical protein
MVRLPTGDYFIYEPAALRNGEFCLPVRWFTRGGVIFAKCWSLVNIVTDTSQGWRAVVKNDFEVSENDLVKHFLDLKDDFANLPDRPDPTKIIGIHSYVLLLPSLIVSSTRCLKRTGGSRKYYTMEVNRS